MKFWYFFSDDRFILKQIKSIEISAFEDFAPRYLDYVNKALEETVSPMAKYVGNFRGCVWSV